MRAMGGYFTSDHFKLLNKWKGQNRDESNPEQNRAYEDLKITEAWDGAMIAVGADRPYIYVRNTLGSVRQAGGQ